MRRKKQKDPEKASHHGLIARAIDNPVSVGGGAVMVLTGCLIVANALGLQPGRHPAPFFATRDRLPTEETTVARPTPSQLILDVQKELRRRGLYEGVLDGLPGPATERAVRRYQLANALPETGEVSPALLARMTIGMDLEDQEKVESKDDVSPGVPVPPVAPDTESANAISADPVGAFLSGGANSSTVDTQVMKVQQLLARLGYGHLKADGSSGQLKADGKMGPATEAAIEHFQLDHHLPLSGELTPSVIKALEQVTGTTI